MNNKSLLILASVTLVLVLYILFFGKEDPGTDALREQAEQVMVFDRESVDRIEIQSPDATLLIAKPEGGDWMIEKPLAYPASRDRIDRLLSELEFSKKVASLDEKDFRDPEATVKNMGLKDPRIRLKLWTEDGVHQLSIGAETARENQVYARTESGKRSQWMVIRKDVEDVLVGNVNDWRSKNLFHEESTEIVGLNLNGGGPDVEVTKEGGDWAIKKPFDGPTEPGKVRSYIANLLASQALAFGTDDGADLAQYGLNNPSWTLTVEGITGKTVLRIGNTVDPKEPEEGEESPEEGRFYAQLESNKVVLEIPQKLVDQISNLLFEVREKRVLPAPVADLKQLTYRAYGLDLKLQRGKTLWEFADEELAVSSPDVDGFLRGLQMARAEEFLQDSEANRKSFGLDQPEVCIDISTADSTEAASEKQREAGSFVYISSVRDGVRYVRSSFTSFILKVADAHLPDFPTDRVVWLARSLKVPPRGDIQSMSWEVPSGPLTLERGKDGQWPEMYEDRRIDQEFLLRQYDILKTLQILDRRTVSDADFENSEFTFTLKTADRAMAMEFALPENQQVLMRLSNDPEGYVLREEDYQRLKVFPLDYREGKDQ